MPLMKIHVFLLIFLTILSNSKQIRNGAAKISSNSTRKITNVIAVPITMYPHVVAIGGDDGKIKCGGSIIASHVVLAPAHCIAHEPKVDVVYAGSDSPGKGERYEICRRLPHPNFYNTSLDYDIGLIFTARPFLFGPRIKKVDIAPHEKWKKSETKFTVAGFGIISKTGETGRSRLYATRVSLLDFETCDKTQTKFSDNPSIPKHVFCLIRQKWTDTCLGDFGSGAFWKRYLVGVVSARQDCSSDMTPSVYTNAVYFKKWIISVIKRFNHKTCDEMKIGYPKKTIAKNYFYSIEYYDEYYDS